MEYERLCDYYDRLQATASRLAMTDILVELLQEADADDVEIIVYLTQGKIAPDFEGVELGLADKLVLRALAFTTGLPDASVQQAYREHGDLGDAAEALMRESRAGGGARAGPRAARQTTLFAAADDDEPEAGPLTVASVHAGFERIARASGAGSQEQKLAGLQSLLVAATPRAAKYLIRTIMGKLRLGIADMTVLDALAVAFATKEERARVERAYNVSSDLGRVADALKRGGVDALDGIRIEVGTPLRAMLAERLPTPDAILEKLGGECLVEYKYDGLRLQAHVRDDDVRFFSRRLEDLTAQFPDVAAALRESFKGREAIVEGEAVAVDPDSGEMRPFQEMSRRRGRKHGIEDAIRDIPVAIFLFDCLLLDGRDLTGEPLPVRRAAFENAFPPTERVRYSEAKRATTTEEILRFFDEAVGESGEGIMCKSVAEDSTYRAGSRGWQWIKYKRDYRTDLNDTLDLVVVGALAGRGRRKSWYGALLMAAYNAEEDVFETVCKLGTGFDDATLASLGELLGEPIEHVHGRVRSKMQADYWFAPRVVAEVVGAELTLSPIHSAAWGEIREGAGLAVRFPRFTGRWRDDKSPEDATATTELVEMYRARTQKVEDAGGGE